VALLRGIADRLDELGRDMQVRAIVLAAEGKTFCAGADLVSANGFGATSSDPLREFYDQVLRVYASPKPIVAAVQGAAIGAGLGLAVAADFRVVAPEARFAANFTKLGFHPGFGLTFTLPRLLGPARAAEMFLTAARYTPEQCAGWGLFERIATVDSVRDAALRFAGEIAENAPLGLLATRATLRRGLVEQVRAAIDNEHAQQLLLQPTEDFSEGVRAVTERRHGNFKGS
ncbi:MAG: enoyl-CoA hydratase/isomerase family protein, partial [Pseudomonadota bacterium]|nr:enoyl-CoA hydratase/isomerase family protein [Pseudomonadota bacterium]